MSDLMIAVQGVFRIAPERVAAAGLHLHAMMTASRAEDGCMLYVYAADLLEPGLFHVSELWRDRAAFDAHLEAAHFRAWRAAAGDIGIHDRRLQVHVVSATTSL